MASGAKKKTTMAKLMRETRLREKRFDKQAKKERRKLEPTEVPAWDAEPLPAEGEPAAAEEPMLTAGAPASSDA